MVVKIYISGMSGNKEVFKKLVKCDFSLQKYNFYFFLLKVKKRQQRVLMILDSKNIKYDLIDITEPDAGTEKEFMQTTATSKGCTIGDTDPRNPVPPQIFNDSDYCGDYDEFDLANEIDTLEQFLKISTGEVVVTTAQLELTTSSKKETDEILDEDKENKTEGENKEV